MAENLSSRNSENSNPDDHQVTVDEYMNWAATFDNLPPEVQYLILKKSGERLIEGGSKVLLQAHQMILDKVSADCDERTLSEQIAKANYAVYSKNKSAYIAAGVAILISVCVAVYKIMKVLPHGFL